MPRRGGAVPEGSGGSEAQSGPGGGGGGKSSQADRVGDEHHDGDGGRGPAWSLGVCVAGGSWGASGLGGGDLGSWCDREHVWPGPLPAWIEPRHQPCGLGRPCALPPPATTPATSALMAPGASRPRTRLVLRPRSRRVAEEAGTKDRPQHPHSPGESALAQRPALRVSSPPQHPVALRPKLVVQTEE